MKEFVEELTKRGVFAKEVPSANIAYHSRYIAHCGKYKRNILSPENWIEFCCYFNNVLSEIQAPFQGSLSVDVV